MKKTYIQPQCELLKTEKEFCLLMLSNGSEPDVHDEEGSAADGGMWLSNDCDVDFSLWADDEEL